MEVESTSEQVKMSENDNLKQVVGDSGVEGNQSQLWNTWQYNFAKQLKLRYAVDVAAVNPSYSDNFVKSIRMAPNGCSFVYSTEDGEVHYIDLRTVDFWGWENRDEEIQLPEILQEYASYRHTEVVYGMDWMPRTDIEAFISCCKDTPIRLWDLSSGTTSSYITYDHVDQVMTAMSCRVLRNESIILGGYRRSLRAFDVERPGRDIYRIDNIQGIISTIDDDYSNTIAFGTFDGSVSLMDSRVLGYPNPITWTSSLSPKGVHEVRLMSSVPYLLVNDRFTGTIRCLDRRNLEMSVYTVQRTSQTQQKLELSLSANEQWMASGDSEGNVTVWNTLTGETVYQQKIYEDAIPCACFHPYNPLMVCGTGQRHFGEQAVPSCCLVYQMPWTYLQPM